MNCTDDEMDRLVTSVPGMEGFLRRRDLPGFYRTKDLNDKILQLMVLEAQQSAMPDAIILNTFEDLEPSTLSRIRGHCPNIYAIRPLHAHLASRLAQETIKSQVSNSLWEEDKSCIPWLDRQLTKSVIYVSFGSLAVITKAELTELWHGLVNSGIRFLWVVRPDSLTGQDGEDQPPAQLQEATRQRGQIVGWAPQEEVLAHLVWVGSSLTTDGTRRSRVYRPESR